MKTYYFIHNLQRADYDYFIDKVSQIRDIQDIKKILKKYFHKIWENNEGRIQKTAFAEALVFLEVFLQKWLWVIEDVEWVYVKNFLIYNENLYEFHDGKYQEIEEKVLFVTSRDSWKNPFFLYLSRHFWDRVQLVKPNLQILDWATDKLTCISHIWEHRSSYVWDIVIPYLCNKHISQVQYLLDFVISKLWYRVMLKNNFWVEGKKVRAIDMSDNPYMNHDLYVSIKEDFFDIGTTTQNNPYFTKCYDIKTEYRVYYTYTLSEGVKIYSIKNRENIPKEDVSIFEKKNFTRENFEIVWKYMHPNDFKLYEQDVYNVALKLIPLLGADTWVLELCKERDGSIRFIEVNYLWGSLMHSWPDEQLMQSYYADMWNISLWK